jgi:hypothetical protein
MRLYGLQGSPTKWCACRSRGRACLALDGVAHADRALLHGLRLWSPRVGSFPRSGWLTEVPPRLAGISMKPLLQEPCSRERWVDYSCSREEPREPSARLGDVSRADLPKMPKDAGPKTFSRSSDVAVSLALSRQCSPQDVDLVGLHALLAPLLGSLS